MRTEAQRFSSRCHPVRRWRDVLLFPKYRVFSRSTLLLHSSMGELSRSLPYEGQASNGVALSTRLSTNAGAIACLNSKNAFGALNSPSRFPLPGCGEAEFFRSTYSRRINTIEPTSRLFQATTLTLK